MSHVNEPVKPTIASTNGMFMCTNFMCIGLLKAGLILIFENILISPLVIAISPGLLPQYSPHYWKAQADQFPGPMIVARFQVFI